MIFLGIDGDSAQTRAILRNEVGQVLGTGNAGGTHYYPVGVEVAVANHCHATRLAWPQAGLDVAPAAGAFLGLAGLKASGDIIRLTAAAEAAGLAPAGTIFTANNMPNALTGGLDETPVLRYLL